VAEFGETEDGFRQQVGAGAAGDVVEEDGQLDGFGDGAEVLELAFLSGLVVVGVGGEDAGEAVDARELFGVGDGLVGGVVRGSGEDGDAAGGGGDGDFDDAEPLLLGERGGLARGADGHEQVYAVGDLPV